MVCGFRISFVSPVIILGHYFLWLQLLMDKMPVIDIDFCWNNLFIMVFKLKAVFAVKLQMTDTVLVFGGRINLPLPLPTRGLAQSINQTK